MQTLIWVLSGLLAGWAAGKLMKGRDYGVIGNIILGLIGSLVGGWLLHGLGYNAPNDLLRNAIVSVFGAVLVLGVARRLRPVTRQTRKVLGDVASVADIEAQFRKLGDLERSTLARWIKREGRVQDPNQMFEEQMTFGQRVADQVARFGGSWTFIGLFLLMMLVWMIINSESRAKWDPYPFILLNLVLSCLAALQAPVIMMSQNRQNAKDRVMANNDYEVNLRAEMEIQKLHTKLDAQREGDWKELIEVQQRQIELLHEIIRDLRTARGEGAEPA